MDTSNFKQEVLTHISEDGFGMTNSARALKSDGKYDLDKLFQMQELDPNMTLKELIYQVVNDAKDFNQSPGFQFSVKVTELGSIMKIYASNE